MIAWYPQATRDTMPDAGPYLGGPYRGVLHTTEGTSYAGARSSYLNSRVPPHFTVSAEGGSFKAWQHVAIDRAARALANLSGGVETNRWSAIQIEVVAKAANPAWPGELVAGLRLLMIWIEEQTGILPVAPVFLGNVAYGVNAPARMSPAVWLKFRGWCGHQHVPENCVAADTPVLRSDLTWVPAAELVPGEEVVGCDEDLVEVGSTGGRRFRPSTVEVNRLFRAQAWRVVTAAGDLITTANHPWLVRWPYVNRGTRTTWVETKDLDPAKHEVYFACEPWATERTHDAGWLAGVLDADGHVQVNRAAGAWVGWGQVVGPMLDRFVAEMESRGFIIKQFLRGADRGLGSQPFVDVRVLGGLWEQLRALGILRPHRLDLRRAWDGAVVGKTTRRVPVLAVEPAGERWFAGLQTSTSTYIANGFVVHNSHWDPGAINPAPLLLREPAPAPTPPPPPPPPTDLRSRLMADAPVLQQGASGHHVRILQSLLTVNAPDLVPDCKAFVDGDFGPTTTRVLSTWQARTTLTARGVADGPTWAWLVGV